MGFAARLLFLFAPLSLAAQEWKPTLDQIRENIKSQLEKTTNYTCVETVERRYWQLPTDQNTCSEPLARPTVATTVTDRLRLDVAVAEDSEIFSWHGESKFTSSDVSDVVKEGPAASGSYVGYLKNVFMTDGVNFTYDGKSTVAGREIHRFSFTVDRVASRFLIDKILVPFHGEFLADANTLRLLSMTLIPDEMPITNGLCALHTTVEYTADSALLIPSVVVLRIGHSTHLLTENYTQYSNCRAFGSESTIRFDGADTPSQAAPAQMGPPEDLPPSLEMRIALKNSINDEIAYVGDALEGALVHAVHLGPGNSVVIPAGTPVHGVIKMMQTRSLPKPSYYVKLEFDRFTFQGKTYSFHARNRSLPDGVAIFKGEHFNLGSHYAADYVTVPANWR